MDENNSNVFSDNEELDLVDISGAEVVRRQYFSHMKENIVTIRPNGIQFNTSCINRFENVTHILVMIDWERNWFIIKPCDQDAKDGQRWCVSKEGTRKPRMISGAPFSQRLYKKLGWCKGNYYKICGTPALQIDKDDELIMVFDFTEAEAYHMTKKSRISAGVDDSEIGQSDLQKLEEFEKQKEIEKAEREAAKAKGETTRKKRKTDHYPESWGDSLGVRYDQHQERIEFPHLPDTAQEAEQMGISFFSEKQETEKDDNN